MKYDNIYLTHLELHVVKPRNPDDWYQAIRKTRKNRRGGMIYSHILEPHRDRSFTTKFVLSPRSEEQLKQEAKGGHHVRFWVPRRGLLVYLGKDVIENLKAQAKKPVNRPTNRRRTILPS